MTPEQKQRLAQIREQMRDGAFLSLPRKFAVREIDFLLSLVKEQEAEVRLLRRASADPQDRQYGATVYDGNGNYSLLADNAIRRNVSEMRSACVEKVKASLHDPSLRFSDEGIKAAVTDWTNILIRRLESLSIEKD